MTTTTYRHTQVGGLVLVILGIGALAVVYAGVRENWRLEQALVLGVLLVVMRLFSTLTVEIRDGSLRVRFGPGFPRRTFRLAEITGARVVRNPWYRGWGCRRLHRGWLYNVSGFSAVEITLTSGGVYRIGTDEPEALLAALQRAGEEARHAPER